LAETLKSREQFAPTSTKIGEALDYLDNQWPLLIRVLDDGRIEFDNYKCENAIRLLVIGRNAWLFSRHTDLSGIIRSSLPLEAAKACWQEHPYASLAHVFAELPKTTTLAHGEALLPRALARPATHSAAA
jgi:transposase